MPVPTGARVIIRDFLVGWLAKNTDESESASIQNGGRQWKLHVRRVNSDEDGFVLTVIRKRT